MAASVRVLYEKLDFGFEILKEILTESILEDEKRLREILNEVRSKSQMRLMSSGHTAAVSRATSYFSDVSYYNEITRASIISSLWSSGYGSLTVKRERSSQALRESWGPFLQGTT